MKPSYHSTLLPSAYCFYTEHRMDVDLWAISRSLEETLLDSNP